MFKGIEITPWIIVIVGFITLNAVMMYRNGLIYNIRVNAVEAYFNQPSRIGEFKDYGSYNEMLWDLKHWNFKDFYPNLDSEYSSKEKAHKKLLIRANSIKE